MFFSKLIGSTGIGILIWISLCYLFIIIVGSAPLPEISNQIDLFPEHRLKEELSTPVPCCRIIKKVIENKLKQNIKMIKQYYESTPKVIANCTSFFVPRSKGSTRIPLRRPDYNFTDGSYRGITPAESHRDKFRNFFFHKHSTAPLNDISPAFLTESKNYNHTTELNDVSISENSKLFSQRPMNNTTFADRAKYKFKERKTSVKSRIINGETTKDKNLVTKRFYKDIFPNIRTNTPRTVTTETFSLGITRENNVINHKNTSVKQNVHMPTAPPKEIDYDDVNLNIGRGHDSYKNGTVYQQSMEDVIQDNRSFSTIQLGHKLQNNTIPNQKVLINESSTRNQYFNRIFRRKKLHSQSGANNNTKFYGVFHKPNDLSAQGTTIISNNTEIQVHLINSNHLFKSNKSSATDSHTEEYSTDPTMKETQTEKLQKENINGTENLNMMELNKATTRPHDKKILSIQNTTFYEQQNKSNVYVTTHFLRRMFGKRKKTQMNETNDGVFYGAGENIVHIINHQNNSEKIVSSLLKNNKHLDINGRIPKKNNSISNNSSTVFHHHNESTDDLDTTKLETSNKITTSLLENNKIFNEMEPKTEYYVTKNFFRHMFPNKKIKATSERINGTKFHSYFVKVNSPALTDTPVSSYITESYKSSSPANNSLNNDKFCTEMDDITDECLTLFYHEPNICINTTKEKEEKKINIFTTSSRKYVLETTSSKKKLKGYLNFWETKTPPQTFKSSHSPKGKDTSFRNKYKIPPTVFNSQGSKEITVADMSEGNLSPPLFCSVSVKSSNSSNINNFDHVNIQFSKSSSTENDILTPLLNISDKTLEEVTTLPTYATQKMKFSTPENKSSGIPLFTVNLEFFKKIFHVNTSAPKNISQTSSENYWHSLVSTESNLKIAPDLPETQIPSAITKPESGFANEDEKSPPTRLTNTFIPFNQAKKLLHNWKKTRRPQTVNILKLATKDNCSDHRSPCVVLTTAQTKIPFSTIITDNINYAFVNTTDQTKQKTINPKEHQLQNKSFEKVTNPDQNFENIKIFLNSSTKSATTHRNFKMNIKILVNYTNHAVYPTKQVENNDISSQHSDHTFFHTNLHHHLSKSQETTIVENSEIQLNNENGNKFTSATGDRVDDVKTENYHHNNQHYTNKIRENDELQNRTFPNDESKTHRGFKFKNILHFKKDPFHENNTYSTLNSGEDLQFEEDTTVSYDDYTEQEVIENLKLRNKYIPKQKQENPIKLWILGKKFKKTKHNGHIIKKGQACEDDNLFKWRYYNEINSINENTTIKITNPETLFSVTNEATSNLTVKYFNDTRYNEFVSTKRFPHIFYFHKTPVTTNKQTKQVISTQKATATEGYPDRFEMDHTNNSTPTIASIYQYEPRSTHVTLKNYTKDSVNHMYATNFAMNDTKIYHPINVLCSLKIHHPFEKITFPPGFTLSNTTRIIHKNCQLIPTTTLTKGRKMKHPFQKFINSTDNTVVFSFQKHSTQEVNSSSVTSEYVSVTSEKHKHDYNINSTNISVISQYVSITPEKNTYSKTTMPNIVLSHSHNTLPSTNESSFHVMAYVMKPFDSIIGVFRAHPSSRNFTKLGDIHASQINNGSIPPHLEPPNSSIVIVAVNNSNNNISKEIHESRFSLAMELITSMFHCIFDTYEEAKPDDVHFYLYTRNNRNNGEELILPKDPQNDNSLTTPDIPEPVLKMEISSELTLKKRNLREENEEYEFEPLNSAKSEVQSKWFNVLSETKVIVHGYLQDYQTDVIANMKDAYLSIGVYNVILMDWSVLVNENSCYPLVAGRGLQKVGALLARLLNHLVEGGMSSSSIHLIGFSLGAHVAGHAGKFFTNGLVPRITGLDPALPYVPMDPDASLDLYDARFVDIIHTSAGVLGQADPMGHVDFYPNGGIQQPGCDMSDFVCSHRRAALYFIESITSETGFLATKCESWHHFQARNCSQPSTLLMGDPCELKGTGKYYLVTGYKPPYAHLPDEHVKVKKSLFDFLYDSEDL